MTSESSDSQRSTQLTTTEVLKVFLIQDFFCAVNIVVQFYAEWNFIQAQFLHTFTDTAALTDLLAGEKKVISIAFLTSQQSFNTSDITRNLSQSEKIITFTRSRNKIYGILVTCESCYVRTAQRTNHGSGSGLHCVINSSSLTWRNIFLFNVKWILQHLAHWHCTHSYSEYFLCLLYIIHKVCFKKRRGSTISSKLKLNLTRGLLLFQRFS